MSEYTINRIVQQANNRKISILRNIMYMDPRDPDYPDVPDLPDPPDYIDLEDVIKQLKEGDL